MGSFCIVLQTVYKFPMQENCNEWGVMAAIEMVVHDSAANMMAIYNQVGILTCSNISDHRLNFLDLSSVIVRLS